MKKIIILLLLLCMIPVTCGATSFLATESNKIESSMTMNQWAHAGMGYVIQDQMKKMHWTFLEREGASIFLAYAKQQWISKPSGSGFKHGSMNAQIIGATLVECKF